MSRAAPAVLAAAIVLAGCAASGGADKPAPSNPAASNVDIQRRDAAPTDARRRAAIRLQLAINYYQDGKFNVALDELKQALTMDPSYADAHNVLALIYMELRENALAEQSFQRALQLEPGNSDLNNNYGWYLCQTGREKDALRYFDVALQNPLYAQKEKPLQNAGVCSLKLGDRVAAEDFFRRSFEMNPAGGVAAYNLAEMFYARKEYARAQFYASQVNGGAAVTPASLWLGVRIERRLGNRTNQVALESQLERLFADSREAALQRRGQYND